MEARKCDAAIANGRNQRLYTCVSHLADARAEAVYRRGPPQIDRGHELKQGKLAFASYCILPQGYWLSFQVLECPRIHSTKTRISGKIIAFSDNILLFLNSRPQTLQLQWRLHTQGEQLQLLVCYIAPATVQSP
jgi:hypothetical protein